MMNKTCVPSAPAGDAISQMQIALNNLMDQVREGYLYLLEGAPAIDKNGHPVVPGPKEQLVRWRQFRGEFEASWRLGTKLGAAAPPPADAADENSYELTQNDALFRAQRLTTVAQCIKQRVVDLPIKPPTQNLNALIETNTALDKVLAEHKASLTRLVKTLRREETILSQSILNHNTINP